MAYNTLWIVGEASESRTVLAEALCRFKTGRTICEFDSCATALAARPGQPPDLLLLNIDAFGLESIPRFKTLWPGLNIIILTARNDTELLQRAISTGAAGVLHKRAPCAEVAFCLRRLAGAEAGLSLCFLRKLFDLVAASSSFVADLGLSQRESEVLGLVAQGRDNQEIANRLCLNEQTVDNCVRQIYEKLQVDTRGAAIAKALQLGWRCPA